jgi:hypothetical protein
VIRAALLLFIVGCGGATVVATEILKAAPASTDTGDAPEPADGGMPETTTAEASSPPPSADSGAPDEACIGCGLSACEFVSGAGTVIGCEVAHLGTEGCSEELGGRPVAACPSSDLVGCCSLGCAPGSYSCTYEASGVSAASAQTSCGNWLCGDAGTVTWSTELPQ